MTQRYIPTPPDSDIQRSGIISTAILTELGLGTSAQELHQAVESGLTWSTFQRLMNIVSHNKKQLSAILHIPPATLDRRAKGGRFSTEESDRIVRYAKVLIAAVSLFEGDRAAAILWLETPAKALGGKRPSDLISTSVGTSAVLDLIGRIEHGIIT